MQKRPPIVVILGSVDHGKTTLLDYIRKTNIADREAGGITQSIGAHEITHPSASSGQAEKITFIDTPGHEAFIKMRARGCHFADIGILMVAADDGVKPQTKESIRILRESETPFVVAINKIDTKGANLEKVKNELTAEDVSLEGYGGNISYQEISAKTGDGVSDLLDLVVLASDLEELKYDPKGQLDGFILESQIDQRRGIATTAVIKNGTLKVGDEISAGKANGKVKALTNFLGEKIKSATASTPVEILGFESLPEVGDLLKSGKAEAKDEDVAQKEVPEENENENSETINIVLRADLAGSLEAISESIKGMDAELKQAKDDYPGIYIADEAVGEVTDGDIKTAVSTKAIVVGFRTKVSKAAENLARGQDVKIITSDVIYDLTKTIRELLEGMKEMAITGKLKILGVFGKKDGNQIVGGEVIEGEIKNQTTLDIERNGEIISSGKIINLQKNKKDAQAVPVGNQCGIIIDAKKKIEIGDHLIAH